jgi:hypothetical protein
MSGMNRNLALITTMASFLGSPPRRSRTPTTLPRRNPATSATRRGTASQPTTVRRPSRRMVC